MRQNDIRSQPFRERERHALGHTACRNEDQGRAILLDERADAIVNVVPHLIARDVSELVARNLNRELELASMTDIDHGRIRTEIFGHALDRFYRCGKSDALWFPPAARDDEVIETGERQRQMRTT